MPQGEAQIEERPSHSHFPEPPEADDGERQQEAVVRLVEERDRVDVVEACPSGTGNSLTRVALEAHRLLGRHHARLRREGQCPRSDFTQSRYGNTRSATTTTVSPRPP